MGYLKKGGHYTIVIETNNSVLTYNITVIECDSMFVTFVDDKQKTYTFNLNKVVSIKEQPSVALKEGENDRNSKTITKR